MGRSKSFPGFSRVVAGCRGYQDRSSNPIKVGESIDQGSALWRCGGAGLRIPISWLELYSGGFKLNSILHSAEAFGIKRIDFAVT